MGRLQIEWTGNKAEAAAGNNPVSQLDGCYAVSAPMKLSRRHFLHVGAASLVGASALPYVFSPRSRAERFGPLRSDPDGILDLPEGFRYRILERADDTMSDGRKVPLRADGMGCFRARDGNLVLMRNHEVSGPDVLNPNQPPHAYDAGQGGGVTRLVVDPRTLHRVSSNQVLAGTARNCAGGLSPWGWLSCEESVLPEHGYVFLCDPETTETQKPRRIPGYGRFNHEAATVDPHSRIAYLTEDRNDSAFYRFVPDEPDEPFLGRLQALRIVDQAGLHTSSQMRVGDTFDITWVDIDEPDAKDDSVRLQAHAAGAAVFRRGEGLWLAGHRVYFCCTTGGPQFAGQIFQLDPEGEGGRLTLVAQSEHRDQLDMPDNITVAPWGDVYMAEDGMRRPMLRGLTPTGEVFDFARNARSFSELAGVCFSPDGNALFVNMQVDGLTLVITGPFARTAPREGDDKSAPRSRAGASGTTPLATSRGLRSNTVPRPSDQPADAGVIAKPRVLKGCTVAELPDRASTWGGAAVTGAAAATHLAGKKGPSND